MSSVTIGYGQLVKQNSNFRYLWFGQIISLLGDWFNLIASAALVALLTRSGLAVGSLFVVRMLAPFLVSPLAGVVADRYNRKTILIISDLARAVTVFGFLLVREPQHVWLLYTLTIIQLGISGFFLPTHTAFLPDIVSPKELGAANTLSSVTWSVMLALGAAIGGLAAGTLGIYAAFVIDGLTFFLSAMFIAWIRIETEAKPHLKQTVTGTITEYIEGLQYLKKHTDILIIVLHKAFITLTMWSGVQVLYVAISEKIFVLGEGGSISLGLLFAINGLGTGIGPLVARRFTGDRDRAIRHSITYLYLISAAGLALSAPLINFPVLLLGTLILGVGGGTIWVYSTQLLLQLLPNTIRGRVFATEFALSTLAAAVAAATSGSLLDAGLTISGILWLTAAAALIPALVWGAWLAVGNISTPPASDAEEIHPTDAGYSLTISD